MANKSSTNPSSALHAVLTEDALIAEAGERYYARGVAYFEHGAVSDLVVSGNKVHAQVIGTADYAVRLWVEDGRLAFVCTCPLGEDGIFCKHAVAAGLSWLAEEVVRPASVTASRDDLAAVRDWLNGAPREVLVELLLDQALWDSALRDRLEARAAQVQAARSPDLEALKRVASRALTVRGFVDYGGMRQFIRRATVVEDMLVQLLDEGHAGVAGELAHYALKRGMAAYERTDDSGGSFGDLLRDIERLYLKALTMAPPDPAPLGKQLFALMLRDGWGLLDFEDYAPLLGERGIRAFRKQAEKQWQQVPERRAGEDSRHSDSRDFQITAIMEMLARHENDIDQLVAIKSRDLTSPWDFLQIAELLAEAGHSDQALDWAERGHAAFPERPDARLVDYLTEQYGQRGRHDEAVSLAWAFLGHQPSLAAYARLKRCAEAGRCWPAWRTKALAWLRKDYLPARQRTRDRWHWEAAGHALLVEIFLWEDDSDAALAEARAGGCTASLWHRIAAAREVDHPGEAAEIYRGALDRIVDRRDNGAYDEAADLTAKIRDLMRHAGQQEAFSDWLEAVRKRHKPKRNFMQRLDKIMESSG